MFLCSGHSLSWKMTYQWMFLWYLEIWVRKAALDLNIFSHRLQGTDTPSKWLASMWFVLAVACPSFPQTLQILAQSLPFPNWTTFPKAVFPLSWKSSHCRKGFSAIFLAENIFEEKCVHTDRGLGHQSQWQDISRLDKRGQVVIES